MEGQIYTVSEVNGFIKNVIDGIPQLSGIYIRGELSNYKIYPSGHHYFTLKDGEGALRCSGDRPPASGSVRRTA